jgi:hypothetical protein
MDSQLLELLVGNLQKEIDSRLSFLGSGGVKSYDEYKEVCGAIRGLQTAQREAQDLVRRVKELDDE